MLKLIATAVLLASTAVVPAKGGQAPPLSTEDLPAGFASWEALFTEQLRLNAIADRIVEAGLEGYAGLVVDPSNHDVRLYWKGELPRAVAAAVEQGRTSAPVHVFSAPHSDVELRAKAQRWIDSGVASDAYPKGDGSGVAVEVEGAESAVPPELPGGARTAYTISYGHDRWDNLAGDSALPPWRWNDVSPYWGGARYEAGGNCTTGFAITDAYGYPGFLTAEHCAADHGNQQVNTPFNPTQPFGEFWWKWEYHDIAMIWVYADVSPIVYTGPWSSDYGRGIKGAASNYKGNYVCTSGAATGEHCAVKVYYASPSDVTVRAERTKSGACAVGKGDSGGPVISQNTGHAWGHGIISARKDYLTCWVGNTPIPGGNDVVYKGLKFALNATGSTLRTIQ